MQNYFHLHNVDSSVELFVPFLSLVAPGSLLPKPPKATATLFGCAKFIDEGVELQNGIRIFKQ